ncbi:formate dehydrogenase accessory sulfurtransferase FdhD [Desulfovibrio sp. SGI.169]|uniref:formate dehydrogenase accessory sulfurtransferase FdhD n=1 Tax=Desulfovibrio sp. SGI.169 TaxID=3420561 RepID=UPI003D03886D
MDAARGGLSSGSSPLRLCARRFGKGRWENLPELAAREEPVHVLHAGGSSRLWAWPHDLEELALGHVLLDCAPQAEDEPGDAPVLLRMGRVERLDAPAGQHCLRVSLAGESGSACRLDRLGRLETASNAPRLSAADLLARMAEFFAAPGLWDGTGSFHRAGLFHPEHGLLRVAEDIGRHNCLDRLAGFCARQGHDPAAHALFLSARITGSLYAKARRAGFALLASRGAVTSAALTAARAHGVSLVGFCRPAEDRLTVFCDAPGRVTA